MIDSHCHLDFAEFDHDRTDVIANARALGVTDFVIPGVRRQTWAALVKLSDSNPCLHHALGLHPYFIQQHHTRDLDELESMLAGGTSVAVGEIGLDYYAKDLDRNNQIKFFGAQLEIATRMHLPVILHVRKAHDEVLTMLSAAGVSGGIVHAFNGSLQQARRYIDLGFYLGFGGMLSFPHSRKLRELARQLPLDCMVLETDAPDMAGFGHQGGRNSPEFLPGYVEAIAGLRGRQPEEIITITRANTIRCLARINPDPVPAPRA